MTTVWVSQDVQVNDTEKLLGAILIQINLDHHVQFLTPPGRGEAVIQRCRVMLSRVRGRLKEAGRPAKHYKLHHSTYPYSDRTGMRHDCVVVWKSKNQRHNIIESLEQMVGHGHAI